MIQLEEYIVPSKVPVLRGHSKRLLAKMSIGSRSDSENSLDMDELLEIGTRCRELRKERDMLKESQPRSLQLIQTLEQHVKSLSEARVEDKRHIQRLEKELKNCSKEIDTLQDQVNIKNGELKETEEHISILELTLAETENLQYEVDSLKDALQKSNTEKLLLLEEIEVKDVELQKSSTILERLEESISSMTLESQCELESMKLDMISLEQNYFECKKIQEETLQEKNRMRGLVEDLEVQLQETQEILNCSEQENREVKHEIDKTKRYAKAFSQMVDEWLKYLSGYQSSCHSSLNWAGRNITSSMDIRDCGDVLGPLLPKLALAFEQNEGREKMEKMSRQIQEYELLVEQLKVQLREEKLKAKDEAEDLAQEMAELKYQITGLLEEECKRRAYIEHVSLQRISELEAQLQISQSKPVAAVGHPGEA